ncbi:uncharacterized protein PGTG_13216 [Puccinia graminis f. sp. tritici CRL 75-36-700-3]|uniref:Uncharacterized protein n=1 Tax=Puccinia graminis f. sp. tritici (strain CRL 75-36-700-3 / race SCCL) TaxID=418459 RepID=E3KRA9_PUCGT|nr:uncharacterized protein PGTG_13216 [Puccinia graminis f. sp. tritici CRL 75-36-700-3]EFP86834.2 hypothetical protein PGTG_13216 [Puccinia graminis f. sp. tritici CRL 75-36-700-3]
MLSQYIVISVWYISAVYGMYPHAASGMKRVGREAIYAGQDDVSGMAREDPTMIYGRPVKKTGHATTSTSQDRQKENVDVSLEEAKEGISALGMKLEEEMKIFETIVDSRKNIKDGQVNKLAGWEYFFGSIDLLFKHGIISQKSLNENLRQMQLVDQLYAYSKIFWDGKLLEVTRQDESYITQHWYFPAFHDSLTSCTNFYLGPKLIVNHFHFS